MTRAAGSLGIGRSTLYRKVQEYSLVDYTDKVARP
jgi:transcriptional regulator of acetoin/glycerol metabolism